MRAQITAAALALVVLAANSAHAREPLVLQPAADWQVKQGDNRCILDRTFGKGEQTVQLELRMIAPVDKFDLLAVGKPLRVYSAKRKWLRYRFDHDADETHPFAFWGMSGGLPALRFSASLKKDQKLAKLLAESSPDADDPGPDLPREAAVNRLVLSGAFNQDVDLELGSMRPPLDMARACFDKLMSDWGIDVAAQKTLTRRASPKGRPEDWLSSKDYPETMLRQGRGGQVDFRLIVDAEGKPASCKILSSYSPEDFAEVVCNSLMANAEFDPALDAQGKPVASYFIDTVTFVIPG